VCQLSESLIGLLLRLSEGGEPALLSGAAAKPFFGPAFQDLLASRILVEQTPATEWTVCDACECDLGARPIRNTPNGLVAECPFHAEADTPLEAEDLRSFEIDIRGVVARIASASGFASQPAEIANQVWSLGQSPHGRSTFLIMGAPPLRQYQLLQILHGVSAGSPATLLRATSAKLDLESLTVAGIHHASLIECLSTDRPFALDLPKLNPRSLAPKLTLFKADQTVLYAGRRVRLTRRSFKLIWLLAGALLAGGAVVGRLRIEQGIWGNALVHKAAAANAVRGLRKELKPLCPRTGTLNLIETKHTQGYLLNLLPAEVLLMP
jgi:DNA-binding winged helix-turn-helix (wHTH) protein